MPTRGVLAAALAAVLLATAAGAAADPRTCRGTVPTSAVDKSAGPSAVAASAAPIELVRGPNFVFAPHATGSAELACAAPALAGRLLREQVAQLHRQLGIDAQLAVVLTSAPIGCSDLFYLPVANDVRGIGYQHHDPREIFDDSPDSRLEGIAFLNDLTYWAEHDDELDSAFKHELGHRWSARVQIAQDGLPPDTLLGREAQHWSYFLDTGGSALEGNRWSAGDGARYVASSPLATRGFSALDLYLMGVLPAERVGPLTLLLPQLEAETDCSGSPLRATSTPQWCTPLAVRATPRQIALEAVVRREGARDPPARATPLALDASVIVLASASGAQLGAASCEALATALDRRFASFAEATGGRVSLRNLTQSTLRCDAWPREPSATVAGSGCSVRGVRAPSLGELLALLGAVGVLQRRRRAARRNAATDRVP